VTGIGLATFSIVSFVRRDIFYIRAGSSRREKRSRDLAMLANYATAAHGRIDLVEAFRRSPHFSQIPPVASILD
jgi:hypothetical protein